MSELAGFIRFSGNWQEERGIVNPNYGADRIMDELIEAKEEPDLYKKLVEYADVFIVLGGSIYDLLKQLNMQAEQFESLVEQKQEINCIKYPVERFQNGKASDEAIAYSRFVWSFNQPEWTENLANDVY